MQAGIPFFPLDTVMNDRMKLIEAEFGLTGFGVAVRLWQKIYQSGYYVEWNDEVALLFAKDVGLGGSVVSEIVSALIRRRIFDQALYDEYGVLTSKRIQKTYFEAVKRRKNVKVRKELLLVCCTVSSESVCNFDENVSKNAKNVCIFEQSKGKESKPKKKRESEREREEASTPTPARGLYENVFLTDFELAKLQQDLPNEWNNRIDHLSEYMRSTGKSYENHFATIMRWYREDCRKKNKNTQFEERDYTQLELDAKIEDPLAELMAEMEVNNED